jgi:hypothetical protein
MARAMSTCRLLWRVRVLILPLSSPHGSVSQNPNSFALSILPTWRCVKERSARKSMTRHIVERYDVPICNWTNTWQGFQVGNSYNGPVMRAARGLDGPRWIIGLDIKSICPLQYHLPRFLWLWLQVASILDSAHQPGESFPLAPTSVH